MVVVDDAKFRRSAWRTEFVEEVDVSVVVVFPLVWSVVFIEDRFHRANRLARTAIDAFIRVDVEHAVAFVNAVNGTFVNAGAVFHVDTRLSDYIGH